MMRRAIAVAAGLLLISVLAIGTAAAQEGQSPIITITTTTTSTTTTSTTSTSVLPNEETTTTSTTTTTEAPTTTTTPPTTAQVAGDVIVRPLPRTGSDLSGAAVFGAALTVTGIALALGARRRRNSFDNV